MPKMKAPRQGITAISVNGRDFPVSKDGIVEVPDQADVERLAEHGFEGVADDPKPAKPKKGGDKDKDDATDPNAPADPNAVK